LPKELALAGVADVQAANRFIAQTYLPAHNARFARPAAVEDSAFVAAEPRFSAGGMLGPFLLSMRSAPLWPGRCLRPYRGVQWPDPDDEEQAGPRP
jgi:hypothetical protein